MERISELSASYDINKFGSFGKTSLVIAIEQPKDDVELIQHMIQCGAGKVCCNEVLLDRKKIIIFYFEDPTIRVPAGPYKGNNALMVALERCKLHTCLHLLEVKKFDPNDCDLRGKTTLSKAMKSNRMLPVMRKLINRGANVTKDILLNALKSGNDDEVILLCLHSIEPSLLVDQDDIINCMIAKCRSLKAFDFCYSVRLAHKKNQNVFDLISSSICMENEVSLRSLINLKVDLESESKQEGCCTAITFYQSVLNERQIRIIKLLICNGVNVDVRGLMEGVLKKFCQCWTVKFLLMADAWIYKLNVDRILMENCNRRFFKKFEDYLHDIRNYPMSLKRQCRRKIRKLCRFGKRYQTKVNSLPLPSLIKDFLKFSEVLAVSEERVMEDNFKDRDIIFNGFPL